MPLCHLSDTEAVHNLTDLWQAVKYRARQISSGELRSLSLAVISR
jgi:hypothetical protein